jgi:acetolactate synthase-1/2/3 large subunit
MRRASYRLVRRALFFKLLNYPVAAADLIINVGHDVIEKLPFFMQPSGTQVVDVSQRTAEFEPVCFRQIEVIGDIGNVIWQLKNG